LFADWRRDVDQLHNLPVKSSLVATYCEAGESGIRVAETLIRYCAKIVSEHQYLNQGWAAVTRNLDENVTQVSTKFTRAYRITQRLPQIQKHSHAWVADFHVVFEALSRIKIPTSLLTKSQTSVESETSSPTEPVTLFEWIESKDPLFTLDSLIEHVRQHIDQVNCFNILIDRISLVG
jgi:hypothetical protein